MHTKDTTNLCVILSDPRGGNYSTIKILKHEIITKQKEPSTLSRIPRCINNPEHGADNQLAIAGFMFFVCFRWRSQTHQCKLLYRY